MTNHPTNITEEELKKEAEAAKEGIQASFGLDSSFLAPLLARMELLTGI